MNIDIATLIRVPGTRYLVWMERPLLLAIVAAAFFCRRCFLPPGIRRIDEGAWLQAMLVRFISGITPFRLKVSTESKLQIYVEILRRGIYWEISLQDGRRGGSADLGNLVNSRSKLF